MIEEKGHFASSMRWPLDKPDIFPALPRNASSVTHPAFALSSDEFRFADNMREGSHRRSPAG
jgi:hypothetical protein